MMKRKSCIVLIILMIWGLALANVTLPSDTVLRSFATSDGIQPDGDLIKDADGIMYGMTTAGGAIGYGTIFKVTTGVPLRSFTTLRGGLTMGRNPTAV